ncbi:TetR/AcrR family transcriptional regulator [Cryptosporangium arvum]|uniref:TetR/AcrR family transcriptional regulator n=1 Tax=Cryptosporangium arvum TaxID=80871 RepID=UPI0004B92D47|nr:TetR/AcrR family transcriptional regulator [Cryptosporangium arvum]
MTDITSLRERRRLATAAEIEAAALELFACGGSEHTTVDDIAAAAGVSPRTFFRYFPTKEDAVLGVKRDFYAAVSERIPPGAIGFDDLAGATAEALESFSATFLHRMVRVRCLGEHDANLRHRALLLDAEQCRQRQRHLGGDMHARLLVETLAVALNTALDDWAIRRHHGEDADLAGVFRATCAQQRALFQLG